MILITICAICTVVVMSLEILEVYSEVKRTIRKTCLKKVILSHVFSFLCLAS